MRENSFTYYSSVRTQNMANTKHAAVAIVHPAAKRRLRPGMWQSIEAQWGPFCQLETLHGQHARQLAANAVKGGAKHIVCVGGDGTVHHAVNGILSEELSRQELDEIRIGIIPCGSANDLVHSIEATLNDGKQKSNRFKHWNDAISLDVGRIETSNGVRYFCNVLGIGFTAQVARRVASFRNTTGKAKYFAALTTSLYRDRQSPNMRVTDCSETDIERPTLLYCAAIGMREGGFPLFRAAQMQDGLFETLHVTDVSLGKIARLLPFVLRGRFPEQDSQVRMCRTGRIEVASASPLICHADGELVCDESDQCPRIHAECWKQHLRMLVIR
ncbi:MAG: diacylglycerol kinase family protein [Pirellulaceae bacterium]